MFNEESGLHLFPFVAVSPNTGVGSGTEEVFDTYLSNANMDGWMDE